MELVYPTFDPIAISLGFAHISWYGLAYLFGFLIAWAIVRLQAKRPTNSWDANMVDDALSYIAFGVILGGRVGYILFYNLGHYLSDPIQIFMVWRGGMSFHGGLLGVILAMLLLAKKYKLTFLSVADFIAPVVPIGLGLGRLGNFINSELWGKVTDSSFGMLMQDPVFGLVKRYPTQLLEALLEGLALGIILWLAGMANKPTGFVSGMFLLGYGIFRSFVEFFRLPDTHIGYLLGDWLTMGHLLSLPMMVFGSWLIWQSLTSQNSQPKTKPKLQ